MDSIHEFLRNTQLYTPIFRAQTAPATLRRQRNNLPSAVNGRGFRLDLAARAASSLFSSIACTSVLRPALCGLAVAAQRITAGALAWIQASAQRQAQTLAPELTLKHAEPRR